MDEWMVIKSKEGKEREKRSSYTLQNSVKIRKFVTKLANLSWLSWASLTKRRLQRGVWRWPSAWQMEIVTPGNFDCLLQCDLQLMCDCSRCSGCKIISVASSYAADEKKPELISFVPHFADQKLNDILTVLLGCLATW